MAPARYYLFEKESLKDNSGKIKQWNKRCANPMSRQMIPFHVEKYELHALRPFLEKIKPFGPGFG
jgi:hypothetical protein